MRRRININQDQLSLPFGQRREVAILYDYRVRAFWALVTVSIVSLATYMYAINAIARHIALRQNLERQISDISTGLDSLEFSYIELRNNVTIELAYEKGFKEEKSPLFVSRSNSASLTFNNLSR